MLEEDGFRKADPSILPAGIAGRPDHCEQLYRHTPAAVANRCREDGYRDAVPSMPRYCPATTLPHDQLVCRSSTLQICMCPFTFLSPGVTFTICILNFVNAMRWQTSTIHKVNALLQHFKLLRPICKQVHPRYFGPKRSCCDRNQFLTFEFVRLELWHWDRCRGIALPPWVPLCRRRQCPPPRPTTVCGLPLRYFSEGEWQTFLFRGVQPGQRICNDIRNSRDVNGHIR